MDAAHDFCRPEGRSILQSLIERLFAWMAVDREISQFLFEAGSPSRLPKDLAVGLGQFKVTRHQISRRILRMNKRLKKKLGKNVAEKLG